MVYLKRYPFSPLVTASMVGAMVADIFSGLERIIEVSRNNDRRFFGWRPDNYKYPVLGEKVLRSASHAARDDERCSLLLQPAGQKAGLVDR